MQKLFTNNTDKIVFESGVLIPPGESRPVTVIPSSSKKKFDPVPILDRPVNALENSLAGLTLDQLNQVKGAEESGANRKTALTLISQEIEKREYDAELSDFARELSSVTNLDELLLAVADDEAKVAMVEQELQSRAEKTKDDNK
ncbi:hypothetical protein [Alteromonas sp. RKMC-009]|uniref:hypothetical protein n=1 Tax=Alteromonas sp. RKMC-009 TaxID=2267264 RepID=UPI0010C53F12|nr:hypothetical protein [Alteromonas sp. RKMC-009]AYA63821.2 hypothetical protein DS731_07305 [Alteromonas sp. RKMC-009]